MITRNFKNLISILLQASNTNFPWCKVPCVTTDGRTYYIIDRFNASNFFPYSVNTDLTLNYLNPGISVGTGDTPSTEYDYNLENTISSGISMSLTATDLQYSNYGEIIIVYKITITNTGFETITIKEIGYKQAFNASPRPDVNDTNRQFFLLDRTVLSTPLTIESGDAGIIEYKLITVPKPRKTISGVEIVDWTTGSDEQITAMITAARNGIINLQTDANWRVGDARPVQISSFTDQSTTIPGGWMIAVISSFEEYESSGNIMQIDFESTLGVTKMNTSNNNNYSQSNMHTTTLPNFYNVLPSYFQNLLVPFSVKVSAGGNSSTINTLTNVKMALRSEVEVFGTTTYSFPGEGSIVELYKNPGCRWKTLLNNNGSYWLRSPVYNSTSDYVTPKLNTSNPQAYRVSPNTSWPYSTLVFAPFCCI